MPNFWDVYARIYDELGLTHPYLDLHRQAHACLDLADGADVLDLGCGTGLFLRRLEGEGKGYRLFGIDASREMLARAWNKLSCRVSLLRHDANDTLPFDDGQFDAVVSMQMLYTMRDPEMVLREMHRVLRPGGRLLLVNPHTPDRKAVLRAHYAHVRSVPFVNWRREARLVLAFSALYVANGYIVRRVGERRYFFLPPDDLKESVVRAGFVVSHLQPNVYGNTSALLLATRP